MNQNQYYRFAFVGVSQSGKTCILGRLAQQTDASKRYSSSLVKPKIKGKVSENVSPKSKDAIALWGYNKIKDAQTALEENRCPDATQTQELGRLLVTFDMTDEERGEFRISTEDYPGELINENFLSGQKTATNELTKKLSQYDGLIFVVETLAPGENVDDAKKYVQNVCRIFSAIKDYMSPKKWENLPLAIIFSKWDKFSPDIDYNNPEAEEVKLQEYREKYPFYENLIKRIVAVTNTQNSQSDLESEQQRIQENTKVFPVSAFGKSVCENGKYRPDKNSQAFGIVAPFAWMVKRLDELTRVGLEKRSKSAWNWFAAWSSLGLWWKARKATQRIPKKLPNGKAVNKIKSRALLQFVVSLVFDLFVAYVVLFCSLHWSDTSRLNQYKKVAYNQSTPQEQVIQAEKDAWAYVNSPLRNAFKFIRSTKPLSGGIIAVNDERDENQWKGVIAEKDEVAKYQAAKERYLKIFPNGKHKEDAINIITAFENKLKDNEIDELKKLLDSDPVKCRTSCNSFIERYKEGVHVEEAKKIRAQALDKIQVKEIDELKKLLDSDPVKCRTSCNSFIERYKEGVHVEEAKKIRDDAFDRIQVKEIEEIKAMENISLAIKRCISFKENYKTGPRVEEVEKIRKDLEVKLDHDKRIAAYRSLYTTKDDKTLTDTLVGLIQAYSITDEDVKKLIDEYPETFKDMLKRKNEGKSDNAIIETYKLASKAVDILLGKLEGNKQIEDLKPYLNEQITNHAIAMDKSLYQKIQQNPKTSNIDDYTEMMKNHGGGKMLKEVTAYKNWLLGQDEEKEYTLSFKMKWDDKTYSRNCRVKIFVDEISNEKINEQVAINKNMEKTLDTPTKIKIKKKFADSVYIKAKFVAEDNWTLRANGFVWGSGAKTCKVSSLINGSEIDLPPNGKLIVTITDAPPKPPLPQWKEK